MYAQISCLISWSTLIYEKEHQYYHWQYGSHVSHEHTHELYHPQHGKKGRSTNFGPLYLNSAPNLTGLTQTKCTYSLLLYGLIPGGLGVKCHVWFCVAKVYPWGHGVPPFAYILLSWIFKLSLRLANVCLANVWLANMSGLFNSHIWWCTE